MKQSLEQRIQALEQKILRLLRPRIRTLEMKLRRSQDNRWAVPLDVVQELKILRRVEDQAWRELEHCYASRAATQLKPVLERQNCSAAVTNLKFLGPDKRPQRAG